MCWHLTYGDLASELSLSTGRGWENCYMDFIRFDAPPALDRAGRLDPKAYLEVVKSGNPSLSRSEICTQIMDLTKRPFEDVWLAANRLVPGEGKPFDKGILTEQTYLPPNRKPLVPKTDFPFLPQSNLTGILGDRDRKSKAPKIDFSYLSNLPERVDDE